jgi:hypothetical protein
VSAGTAAFGRLLSGVSEERQKKPLQRNKADEPCLSHYVVISFCQSCPLSYCPVNEYCAASSTKSSTFHCCEKGVNHVLHCIFGFSADVTPSSFGLSWRRFFYHSFPSRQPSIGLQLNPLHLCWRYSQVYFTNHPSTDSPKVLTRYHDIQELEDSKTATKCAFPGKVSQPAQVSNPNELPTPDFIMPSRYHSVPVPFPGPLFYCFGEWRALSTIETFALQFLFAIITVPFR